MVAHYDTRWGSLLPGGYVKEILLTQGYVALVDDADYEWLLQWNWCVDVIRNTPYTKRRLGISEPGAPGHISMHRQIVGAKAGQPVDHRNRNTLDNQRGNLRVCTRSQNQGNRKKQSGGSSRFKGVHWHKRDKTWRAAISRDGNTVHIGTFDDELDAARAYNVAATEHFKEFALLNEV